MGYTKQQLKFACTTNVNVDSDKKCRPWHKGIGHSGTGTMFESLPHIIGVDGDEGEVKSEFSQPRVIGKSVRIPQKKNP